MRLRFQISSALDWIGLGWVVGVGVGVGVDVVSIYLLRQPPTQPNPSYQIYILPMHIYI